MCVSERARTRTRGGCAVRRDARNLLMLQVQQGAGGALSNLGNNLNNGQGINPGGSAGMHNINGSQVCVT